jgi:hypothetical protein
METKNQINGFQVSPEELKRIVTETKATLEQLMKAEEPVKEESSSASEKSAPEESSSSVSVPPEGTKPEESSASESSVSGSDKEPKPEEMPSEEAQPTVQDLTDMYAQLSDEDFQAHLAAIKAAQTKKAPAPQESTPAPEAPVAPESAPAPMATPAPIPEESKKSELPLDLVKKSELVAELTAIKQQFETLSKGFETMNVAVQEIGKLVTVPARKSVAQVSQVAIPAVKPSLNLNKSEVAQKLREVALKADLAKSDREIIDAYTLGHVGYSHIVPILEKFNK